jgi:hypothetical protein
MNYNLRSLKIQSLIFAMLPVLVISILFSLSGCQTNTAPNNGVNMDSVKAHVIPIEQAIRWTAHFRATVDSLQRKCPQFKDSLWLPRAEAFNSDLLSLLLSQKDSTGVQAAGIRIYYGLDEKGVCRMVLVPYDKNNNDIINHLTAAGSEPVPGVSSPKAETSSTTSGGQTGETGQQCPTLCSDGGGL